MKEIAIVVVTYNRLTSLQRLLSSLCEAFYVDYKPTLIISIDKSETDAIEKYADEFIWKHGKKIVDKHEVNLGLRPHMMSLGKWFDSFDALVVLEDDLVVSKNFFFYTRKCVEKYYDYSDIAGISLYRYEFNYQTQTPFSPMRDEHDAFFMQSAMSWGEVWMKDSWRLFYNWYINNELFTQSSELPKRVQGWGKNSWLKYHTRYCIENNLYFVYPYVSLTTNFGEAGVHSTVGYRTAYQTVLQEGIKSNYNLPDFDNAVKYDGFFENILIYKQLGLTKDELCIDLQGGNYNVLNKRYWLTTRIAEFKVLQSYSLQLRPIESNVIYELEGKDIFLYDTFKREGKRKKDKNSGYLYFFHIDDVLNFLRSYGLRNFVVDFFRRLSILLKK